MKHVDPEALSGALDLSGGNRAVEVKGADEAPETLITKALENLQESVDKRIAEIVAKQADAAKLVERLDKIEAKQNRPGTTVDTVEPSVEKKAFVNFLRSDLNSIDALDRKALTIASDMAAGSVLAPEETSREFIRNLVEFSPIRSIADVRSTGSHTITLPKRLTVTNAKWKGEAVASESSEPTFGDLDIVIKEMTTHVDVGMWLIEDAANDVEAEVRLALAEDFGAKEGLAFVSGSLAVEPEGFMVNADVPEALNGHATELQADALISMIYSLPAAYRNAGSFVMNGTTLATIRKLKDGAGNYLWQPAYTAGQPETILGRPVVEVTDMPDIAADAFPIAFGAFKQAYRIYDRIELAVRPNPYLLATEGKIRFHARRRVGAGVVRPDALRKLKIATV
ncbi:MAG: phage major capsid protein [Mesorhizobium sp.]|nr:phage major capsid protein [Mesorhizobium sp.]MCO5159824.1 phage major capsid protein [Mesorhizobium sp.]